jgi:hypothetical protein
MREELPKHDLKVKGFKFGFLINDIKPEKIGEGQYMLKGD